MINKHLQRLGLGTVQFGDHYGIANTQGQVSRGDVEDILKEALSHNVYVIDTADGYGESENILGQFLSGREHPFHIISKFSIDSTFSSVETCLQHSLIRLNQESIYGYLFHQFNDFVEHPYLWDELRRVKNKGLAQKIGFSIYSPHELQNLLDQDIDFDLIQIPLNIFDQRFIPTLPLLKEKGVEIHTRSVFLQGLFFLQPDHLPKYLAKATDPLKRLHNLAVTHNLSIPALCLNFVLLQESVDCVIVGVDSLGNFQDNLQALSLYDQVQGLFDQLAELCVADEDILLPFRWALT